MITGWMTTAEVARRLGVTPTAVLRLKDRGTLPAVWTGRTWFFRETAVDALNTDEGYRRRSRRDATCAQ